MFAVDLELDPEPRVSARASLFPTQGLVANVIQPSYDLAPGGDRFLMTRLATNPSQLVIVQNFFEELNELVPN